MDDNTKQESLANAKVSLRDSLGIQDTTHLAEERPAIC